VNSVLYPIAAVVAWAAAGYKLRDLIRNPREPALIALSGAFVALAVTFTLSTPVVWVAVDRWAGFPNLVTLLSQGCVMVFAATVQVLLLFWSYPPERAWPKARRRLIAAGIVVTLMVGLFLSAPRTEERPTDFVARYAGEPHIAAYLLIYIAAFAVVQTELTVLCLRYARAGGRPWLRRGLRITAAGAVLGLVYCVARLADVIGAPMGLDPMRWEVVARLSAGLGVLLPPIGWTIPSWGPRLSAVGGWFGRYRAYRRLYPLWAALYAATPDIALDPPASALADRLTLRDLKFRLYGRVIEIRDGHLALRAYLDPAVAEAARREGEAAGLDDERLRALVVAAQLRAALDAKARGATPAEPVDEPLGRPGGADLSDEIASLVRTSVAFARSPLVATVGVATGPTARR